MPERSYAERADAQQPALDLLQRLGYTYLPPDEARALRGGNLRRVLLEPVLDDALARINTIHHRGETAAFSEASRRAALAALRDLPDRGVGPTSQAAYELLTLGKSFEETIGGDRKAFTLHYVDWQHPERNAFHVTDELAVRGPSGLRRADLVLFVNGIPFAVVECKRRDQPEALEQALNQLHRYQQEDGIPRLFWTAQLVLGGHPNAVRYGTSGTDPAFFSVWREPEADALAPLLDRTPTEQDRTLWALLRPARLLEMAYRYVLFDAGQKKVARHQQVAAVEATLERIQQRTAEGRRRGGIIWHTQGSGKSITMVLLFKALALMEGLGRPRVLLVTDRINLDEQIESTFRHCGKVPVRAESGRHLLRLLGERRADVVTTVLDKFNAALKTESFEDPSDDLFVLVDEAHRSQYGAMHARMRQALPNACFIAFTGTPIARPDRHTAARFGDFIHTYTIDEAVRDEAVVPLLYESRAPELSVNKAQVDRGFERVTEPLTTYQKRELQERAARKQKLYASEQVVEEVAHDIAAHYAATWKGTGFKAQLTVARKETALRYLRAFEQIGAMDPAHRIEAAVVISPPGKPEPSEGDDSADEEEPGTIRAFWAQMMKRFGTRENYEKHFIGSFTHDPEGVELLIVVDKLLTGFDAPRNTILYVARSLTSHTLLQAIARVNRVFDGKDFGLIVDYWGLLGPLDRALTEYAALAEFDEKDLSGTLAEIRAEVEKLPQRHAALVQVFAPVATPDDAEALEQFLADEERRHRFYDRLADFARTLHLARSTLDFYRLTPEARIARYDRDLAFYRSLRLSVQNRNAERLDHRAYEPRIRTLLDRHVYVEDVTPLSERPINIFDPEAFLQEVERAGHTKASRADIIASQVKRTLRLRMDEDPARYRAFSQRLEEAIAAFHQQQLEAAEYLARVRAVYDELVHGDRDAPSILRPHTVAAAYYSSLVGALEDRANGEAGSPDREALARTALDLEALVDDLLIVDWQHNPNVEAAIQNAVEDYLLAFGREHGLSLSYADVDLVLDDLLKITRERKR